MLDYQHLDMECLLFKMELKVSNFRNKKSNKNVDTVNILYLVCNQPKTNFQVLCWLELSQQVRPLGEIHAKLHHLCIMKSASILTIVQELSDFMVVSFILVLINSMLSKIKNTQMVCCTMKENLSVVSKLHLHMKVFFKQEQLGINFDD